MRAARLDPKTDADSFITDVKETRVEADNEEELRDGINSVLDDYIDGLELSTTKEVEKTTISGGRMDTVYGDLIIEYKEPNALKQQKNIEEAILGRESSTVGGLRNYMVDSARHETSSGLSTEEALARKVGVGFDGYRIFFYKFHPGTTMNPVLLEQRTALGHAEEGVKGEFDDPEAVDIYSLEEGAFRLLSHLRGLARKALTPK
jgi:hypothetical protein